MKELLDIQRELKAPKNQFNSFGKYNYRSCEDILEALKPLLSKYGCTMTISDDIVNHGNRFYIKATATIKKGDQSESVSAFAREAETKKGMDDSQITRSASSYARKYALNGLYLIDDTKDADSMNNSGSSSYKPEKRISDSDIAMLKDAKRFYISRNETPKVAYIENTIASDDPKNLQRIIDTYLMESGETQ